MWAVAPTYVASMRFAFAILLAGCATTPVAGSPAPPLDPVKKDAPPPVAEVAPSPREPAPPAPENDPNVAPLHAEFPPCLEKKEEALGCTASCEDDFFVRRAQTRCPTTLADLPDDVGIVGVLDGTSPRSLGQNPNVVVMDERTTQLRTIRVESSTEQRSSDQARLVAKLRQGFLTSVRHCWRDEAPHGVPPVVELHARATTAGDATWRVVGPQGAYRGCVEARMPKLAGVTLSAPTSVRLRAVAWAMTAPPQTSE